MGCQLTSAFDGRLTAVNDGCQKTMIASVSQALVSHKPQLEM